MSKDNKVYVRLKDSGTSFWDMEQGAGVVHTRVAELDKTSKVSEWIRKGLLVEVPAGEAKDALKEQAENEKVAKASKTATEANKEKAPKTLTKKEQEAKAAKEKADQAAAEKSAKEAQALVEAKDKYKSLYGEDAQADVTIEGLNEAIATKEAENAEAEKKAQEEANKKAETDNKEADKKGNKASPLSNLD